MRQRVSWSLDNNQRVGPIQNKFEFSLNANLNGSLYIQYSHIRQTSVEHSKDGEAVSCRMTAANRCGSLVCLKGR